ncbi:MAG TPA: RDD family protein [Bryobacteraceae bacterium]|nr:RDD family protein [Bryobacteraceae bacterium]
MVHRTAGALATKLRPAIVVAEQPSGGQKADLASAVQGSLFSANVIAMPIRVPVRPPRAKAMTPASLAAAKPAARRAPRQAVEAQGQFEFFAPVQNKPKTLGTTVDGVIYCEAPVATPLHRSLAATIDLAMIFVAYGLFLLTFVLCRGEIAVTRQSLIVFGAMWGVIAATYGLFWTVAGTETVGMRATHLRLITFDGFTPEPRQRAARLVGTCLSFFSVLGILWSLADEEGLGWQDHISRTFPTAHELESRVFRRR